MAERLLCRESLTAIFGKSALRLSRTSPARLCRAVLLKNIKYGSTVYTDSAVGYDKVSYNFVHDVVNHAERYVNGRVHTNGLENFWSLLKRGLRGTYVAVEPFHLFRYVDEQVFRYNNRATKEQSRERCRPLQAGNAPSRWPSSHLLRTDGQRRIAAPRIDRGGGNASPLLVLVGRFAVYVHSGRGKKSCVPSSRPLQLHLWEL